MSQVSCQWQLVSAHDIFVHHTYHVPLFPDTGILEAAMHRPRRVGHIDTEMAKWPFIWSSFYNGT